jgi:hypothetical protein
MAADYKSTLNDLKIAATCFMPQCMGEKERLAIELHIRLKDLAAVSNGTTYTVASLLVAAKAWTDLRKDERQAIGLYLDLQNAIADSSVFPSGSTANGLKIDSRCVTQCMGEEQLRNLNLFLKWKLNTLGEAE